MTILDAVSCRLIGRDDATVLEIMFSPDIHPENVLEIVRVIEKTVASKLTCMAFLAQESEYHGQPGRS